MVDDDVVPSVSFLKIFHLRSLQLQVQQSFVSAETSACFGIFANERPIQSSKVSLVDVSSRVG